MVNRVVEGGEPSVGTAETKSGLLSPDALFDKIRSVGIEADWSDEECAMVDRAYRLVKKLHENDTHRGLPYVYHLLEIARIVTEHFHITDPRIITAALLHDIVEDHPRKLLRAGDVKEEDWSPDPARRIEQGFAVIKEKTTELTAVLVTGMTNPIKRSFADDIPEEQAEKLQQNEYIEHVKGEVKVPLVWMLKFADWVHNGVGIVDAEKDIDLKKLKSRRRKYFRLMEELKARYNREEFLIIFAQDTIDYIEEQIRLGSERLTATGDEPVREIGSIALGEGIRTSQLPISSFICYH